ncbi:Fibrinogen-like protein A,Ryncolin-4,Fibrinogen C domain-containing protein 1-A,Angiopoietin-2,Microfibril-associated glycoprotein 4,Angiopoietin-related protein 7,Ficolin-2,Tenascin,Fibrinogen C domain-containing protein 1-B,Fibrinogen C domain-containing protein 1 [Mytilus coruscus]|uniref:Fibrinogen C-terminal domain-containing protein n=1 Tax=Mytilus coruscus TaxID=42192 RepID=A0A6J8A748_MYTCO|nr:Fibrinogen-like protein A,Ryncolin-4,Fibrinogen C domain-containing protein 1-A,Angiopoietin-2,Microfibril-associated glycoprotein 4,Angiopoietin-related protein 7,Ficolin-2,Tenascin,Fibrinogen C domain-containing protein 1-B,Fibrinogen C domain-containing protein 1 [Mytilus coruscus]
MEGFRKHFANLAVPIIDEDFNYTNEDEIKYEMDIITELTNNSDIKERTKGQIYKALESMKKGKASDLFDLTVENFIYAGNNLIDLIHQILVYIFRKGLIPDLLKTGLLSPVFKHKGSIVEIKNYRDLRTYRESEEKTRVDDILHDLQGICLHENEYRDVTQLKKDTQSILKNMAVYKDIVKMNKQLKDDIKWIIEESRGEKEVARIIRLLKHEVKGICGRNKDCTEIKKSKTTSGVYQIFPDKAKGVKAYCDMDTDGGGWTIIQKRYENSVNFQRTWTECENGLGNVNGDIGLVGNTHIHHLTSSGTYELRIDLTDKSNNKKYARYNTFVVGNATSQYKLTISGYSGNAGDSLTYSNGMNFATVDRDTNINSKKCAKGAGPWWFKSCSYSALNSPSRDKWYWHYISGHYVKTSVMMIRKI